MSEKLWSHSIPRQEQVVLNTGPADPPPQRCPECQISAWRPTMRKLIIAALAAASLLTAVSAANAGYFVPIWNGYYYVQTYVPTCGYDMYGFWVCG